VKIDYTVQVWRRGTRYIAHAMPLDVASAGDMPEGARQAVDEAVRSFLDTASEDGTLEEVLKEAVYRREEGSWRRPDWLGVE
jgi:hypothetical protein